MAFESSVVDTPRLLLEWRYVPWDSIILGRPVLEIFRINVRDYQAEVDLTPFEAARDSLRACLVSCRLSCDQLNESMFLENNGFRFIEMIYQPELTDLSNYTSAKDTELKTVQATPDLLPAIEDIAGRAFHNERYHVDPRLDPSIGDQRYRNWVRNSLNHEKQRLIAIHESKRLVAFFVTEMLEDGTCYWHLNAIAPELQGQGYGKRVWRAMIDSARQQGAKRILTSITARNHRVLNLYARLGFRFSKPLMTFHWVEPTFRLTHQW